MSKITFINMAAMIAKRSPRMIKVGAIVVKGGNMVAFGHNEKRYTRDLKDIRGDDGLCAELRAVLQLLRERRLPQLCGSTMYVTRVRKNDKFAMAKPCFLCEKNLRTFGVRKVFYTDDNSNIQELKL